MFRLFATSIVFVSVIFAAPTIKDKAKPDDAKLIVGIWLQDSESIQGRPTMAANGVRIVFKTMGECAITHGLPGGTEYVATYTLTPHAKPKSLQWATNTTGNEWTCLYEINADKLTIAFIDLKTEAPAKIEPAKNLSIYHLTRSKD